MIFISAFGVLQGVLLSGIIYFHPKSDKTVNAFLALHILFISAVMIIPVIIPIIGWQNSSLVLSLPLLPGPLLYLYLRNFKERVTWQQALPHFIIFFIVLAVSLGSLSYFTSKYPDARQVPREVLYSPLTITLMSIRRLQPVLYYFFSRKTLLSYQRSVRQLFSETSGIDLHWARFLISGFLFISLMLIVNYILVLRSPSQYNLWWLITMVVGTAYIYMATYKGVMQKTVWQSQPSLDKETVEQHIREVDEHNTATQKNETFRSPKTGLLEHKMDEISNRISRLMKDEKLYQETELTLHQLAGKLGVPTYQVSQALNEGMNKNFYDLVNGYRVEEAKRLLLDSKNRNYTVLSVGFEAGFNSKTTFNTVFKRFTGMTPTEFRGANAMKLAV